MKKLDPFETLGWLNLSREYFEAVNKLNASANEFTSPPGRPMWQLLGIGLEVCMKADLLWQGYDETTLKKNFGHSLSKLLERLDNKSLKTAETTASKHFRQTLKALRDKHIRDLGDVAQHMNFPSNESIGNHNLRVKPLVDEVSRHFSSEIGYKYYQAFFSRTTVLQFPPFREVPTMFLTIFGEALTDEVESAIRTEMMK